MVRLYRRSDLSWIPIRDVDSLQTALGRLQGSDVLIVHAFTDAIHEVIAQHRASTTNGTESAPQIAPHTLY